MQSTWIYKHCRIYFTIIQQKKKKKREETPHHFIIKSRCNKMRLENRNWKPPPPRVGGGVMVPMHYIAGTPV